MKQLNFNAGTISGIFGFDTLAELKECKDIDVQRQATFISIINNNLTEREVVMLAGILSVITGQNLDSNHQLIKYFFKLDQQDLDYIINIICNCVIEDDNEK